MLPRFLASFQIAGLFLVFTSLTHSETVLQSWVQRYSYDTGSTDGATKVITDAARNVIVLGAQGQGSTMVTVKYSSAGVPLWTNRYSAAAPAGIDADDDGTVFVAGSSLPPGSTSDFVAIAYSSAGIPLWTNRYNGTGNSDAASGIAVDLNGNVYVTGSSWNSATGYDFLTVAYSPLGALRWARTFASPTNGVDIPSAIAIDNGGRVFVTGRGFGYGVRYDYTTIAYSSAGVPLWTNRYDGPGNASDEPGAIALDGAGTVFITGKSVGAGLNEDDYATIAYSGDGVPLWTNRYDGPGNHVDHARDIAVFGSLVFVTGNSWAIGGTRCTTIAYSQTGNPVWTNDHAFNLLESAALAVDASGNAFVALGSAGGLTSEYRCLAYSSAGVAIWTNSFNGGENIYERARSVAVDNSGNVLVSGESQGDWITIAFSNGGLALWTNRFSGIGDSADTAHAVATDYQGNIVVTGSSWNGRSSEYATIAFSSDGMPLWTNRHTGALSYHASALGLDRRGTAYVTGTANDASYRYSIVTIAYASEGIPLWTNTYAALGNGSAGASSIAVNDTGTVFIAGGSHTINGGDLVLVAYSGHGAPLWTNFYNGPGNSSDGASTVTAAPGGSVFVTGASYLGTIGSPFDCVTLGYGDNGTPLWTNIYSGVALDDGDEVSMFMAVGSNAVYVAGGTSLDVRNGDFLTLAYSRNGVPLWTNFYNDRRGRRDRATGIAIDYSNNVYVTGRSLTDFFRNDRDYATVAYSASGIPLWTNTYNGPANGEDDATGVAVDTRGNVFVTGWSRGVGNVFDFVTIVYSNSGVPLHTNRYDSGGNDRPLIKSPIRITEDGFVIAGSTDLDYAIVKYLTGGPLIRSSVSGGELLLSWPSLWTNFLLQQNFDPVAGSSWTDVPQPPNDDGVRRRVSVPVDSRSRLFRLSR
jgi:hypothetical protein